MSRLNSFVVQLVGRAGVEIMRYRSTRHAFGRRMRLMATHGIDMVLDVGASVGQYGRDLRRMGYRGRIASFEPLSAPFAQLARAAAGDARWIARNHALGAARGTAAIHVAGNSASSSLLDMLPRHRDAAPASAYEGTEQIAVETLDALFDEVTAGTSRVLLKIDTQGFEDRVLAGARASLARIDMIQLEMSLTPLYAGQVLFHDLDRQLTDQGYRLVSVEPGFADERTGELLQLDGTYHRDPATR